MWIFLSDAFLSIVESGHDPNVLAVRARAEGDIERVFPGWEVHRATAGQDYAFRAFVPRRVVAQEVWDRTMRVDYTNFKASVEEDDRHDFYMDVWTEANWFQRWRKLGKKHRTTLGKRGYANWRPRAKGWW